MAIKAGGRDIKFRISVQDKASEALKELGAEFGMIGKNAKAAAAILDSIASGAKSAAAGIRSMTAGTKAFDTLMGGADKAAAAVGRLNMAVQSLSSRGPVNLGLDLNTPDRLGEGFLRANGHATTLLGTLRSLAPALGGLTVGTAALDTIKTFASFESQMSQVRAVVDDSAKNFDALWAAAKQAGATTVFSATEAAQAMTYLGQAGLKSHDIIAALPHVLNLAAAGSLDLAKAADIAVNVLNGFGLPASQMQRVADVIAKAAAATNTSVEEMGEAMKYAVPAARALNRSLEETAAYIGIVSNAGIKGSMAGTAFRTSLARLADTSNKETAKALAKLGLTFDAVNPKTHSMSQVMQTLASHGAKVSDMFQIFGIEASSAALMAKASKTELAGMVKALGNSAGAAEMMAKIMSDNLMGSWKEFMSAVEGLQISLGETGLAAGLRDVVQGMTSMVRGVDQIVGAIASSETAVATITFLVRTLGLAAVALGTVGAASLAFSLGVRAASVAMTLFNTVVRANPLMMIATVVAVAVSAVWSFVDAMKNAGGGLSEFGQKVQQVWVSVKPGVDALVQSLLFLGNIVLKSVSASAQNLWNVMKLLGDGAVWLGGLIVEAFDGWKLVFEGIGFLVGLLADGMAAVGQRIAESFTGWFQVVQNSAAAVFEAIMSAARTTASAMLSPFTVLGDAIRWLLDTLGVDVGAFLALINEGFKTVFGVDLIATISDAVDYVKSMFKGLWEIAKSFFDAIGMSFSTAAKSAGDFASEVGNDISNGFGKAYASASRFFDKTWKEAGEAKDGVFGLAAGVMGLAGAHGAVAGAAGSAYGAMETGAKVAGNAVENLAKRTGSALDDIKAKAEAVKALASVPTQAMGGGSIGDSIGSNSTSGRTGYGSGQDALRFDAGGPPDVYNTNGEKLPMRFEYNAFRREGKWVIDTKSAANQGITNLSPRGSVTASGGYGVIRRFHTGGIPGTNEVSAVLQKTETVLTEQQTDHAVNALTAVDRVLRSVSETARTATSAAVGPRSSSVVVNVGGISIDGKVAGDRRAVERSLSQTATDIFGELAAKAAHNSY